MTAAAQETSEQASQATQTIIPTTTVESVLPEQTPAVYSGDVPAYLEIGLPVRSEMSDAQEYYYYQYDLDLYALNIEFDGQIKADLDGDRQDESIMISYNDKGSRANITVNIDDTQLGIKGLSSSDFILYPEIIDIDRTDGKKEIAIHTLSYNDRMGYIIAFDHGQPEIIFSGNIVGYNLSSGTGYIETWENISDVNARCLLWQMKDDRSGFEEVAVPYYTNTLQVGFWDANDDFAAETLWDQYLAEEPGGTESTLVPEGTSVYIGLYDKREHSVMILDMQGSLLGWLDMRKCDVNDYTGWAFTFEGE